MVVLVQFLNVKASSTLVHVHSLIAHGALDLDSLGSVAFLGVQFPSVTAHWLDCHDLTLLVVAGSIIVRGRNNGLSCWVETEVRLVHELLVEGRVNGSVVV